MSENQNTVVPQAGEVNPGAKFNRWTVLSFSHKKKKNKYWLCRCECGTEKIIGQITFVYGGSKSCGCLLLEQLKKRATHGQSAHGKASREYTTWANMIQRCTNPNHPRFRDYGGRGIGICDRWLDSFENFFADMGPRPPKMTLDRWPDGDGDYELGNCRWATVKQQNARKRNGRLFEYKGEMLGRHELAERFGLSYATIKSRINKGWSIEDAVNKPVTFNPRWHVTQKKDAEVAPHLAEEY